MNSIWIFCRCKSGLVTYSREPIAGNPNDKHDSDTYHGRNVFCGMYQRDNSNLLIAVTGSMGSGEARFLKAPAMSLKRLEAST